MFISSADFVGYKKGFKILHSLSNSKQETHITCRYYQKKVLIQVVWFWYGRELVSHEEYEEPVVAKVLQSSGLWLFIVWEYT
ncbi:hypothetical protein V6N12_058984 [Hibiscus sabdariffa]|uniref:Uncharacterized protein n=1 Tax=Hibiscus sabdariffa TaxID=183260 RepID=A0ABR2ETQ9_9ROSI